ncbi:hypothetical protein BDQ17DRAFT_1332540 [Cyathus striatus]|nr:hypothetical protein BDQ17DRAFT_1332540 [Cyathus striatus]
MCNPKTGSPISGIASPTQGAMFAQLAINVANHDISQGPSQPSVKKKNVGAIAGGVVGENYDNDTMIAGTASVVSPSKGGIPHDSLQPCGNPSTSVNSASTTMGVASSSNGPDDSVALRTEMEQLRREMHALRNERVQDIEPPPMYDFGTAGTENIPSSEPNRVVTAGTTNQPPVE